MAILQAEAVEAGDFSYPEHAPDLLVIGGTAERTVAVCRVCGRVEIAPARVNDLGGQPEAPRFGADEHLTW